MKKRLLIANRGEIAIRIARTAREYGYFCIGMAREKDAQDLYLSSMDEVAFFDEETVQETFLSEKAIISLAKKHAADLLHPGYGFLSESSRFAKALASAGITFIGPSPKALDLLGNKVKAKELAEKLSVPVVPGYRGELSELDAKTKKLFEEIEYPILIKAGAGGGGRGMRIVHKKEELPSALSSSRDEALRAFGDGTLFIEKFIEPARHIEVQVCGDTYGAVIHLFERDCSLQRRFQKIIEVAPAEGVPASVLQDMREAAVVLAKGANLVSLATVEFLYYPKEKTFYFMECNPRLQVEHTITEEITGVDLVRLQLDVIEGKHLPSQDSIVCNGVAIQARVCAEVPEDDGRPATGSITHYATPEDVRVDSGIDVSSKVTNDFDSLLCKVIVKGDTFEDTKIKLIRALRTMKLAGVPASTGFLIRLLASFKSFSTCYISSVGEFQKKWTISQHEEMLGSLAAFFYAYVYSGILQPTSDPYSKGIRPREFQFLPLLEIVIPQFDTRERVQASAYIPFSKEYAIVRVTNDLFRARSDGQEAYIQLLSATEGIHQGIEAIIEGYQVSIVPAKPEVKDDLVSGNQGDLIAPLPGTVISVSAIEGKKVEKGDALLSFDSMKTEHVLSAPSSGIVKEIRVAPGDTIERGQLLIHLANVEEK